MGSKWRLAKKYGAPRHNLVIEPFAGGACYSLYWEAPKVLLFDLNPAIAGIWKYLIAAKESEILKLPLEFESTAELDIPQEAKWLIGFWITKGNTAPNMKRSAWARKYQNSGNCLVWGEQVRARIANQGSKIRSWEIRCEDYRNAPNVSADWFIDPPYAVAGKAYKFSDVDYTDLADFCMNRWGRVTVCENEGADWLPFEPFAHTRGTSGKVRSGISKEVIYYDADV